MHKNTQAPAGHELPPPSLLAPAQGAASHGRDEGDDASGILDAVGHGRRPSRKARSHRAWVALTGVIASGLLGWAVWMEAPRPTGPQQVASVPALPQPRDNAHREGRVGIAALAQPRPVTEAIEPSMPGPAAVPEVARIESVEAPASVSAGEGPKGASASAAPSSVTPQPTPSQRAAMVSARDSGRARSGAAGERMPDPDVELIEVLMSHTGPAGAVAGRSGSTPARASASSQDVVLVQAGVPTEELLRRCMALGGLEEQLCRARICDARGAHATACSGEAAAARRP